MGRIRRSMGRLVVVVVVVRRRVLGSAQSTASRRGVPPKQQRRRTRCAAAFCVASRTRSAGGLCAPTSPPCEPLSRRALCRTTGARTSPRANSVTRPSGSSHGRACGGPQQDGCHPASKKGRPLLLRRRASSSARTSPTTCRARSRPSRLARRRSRSPRGSPPRRRRRPRRAANHNGGPTKGMCPAAPPPSISSRSLPSRDTASARASSTSSRDVLV
mmetsp:Transcript_5155/g.21204  ORF Transcript_5155/g.21204 Transcript_5155/m.21204 type:complete len:217 (-) Transcript_5155:405-1055(-)